MPLHSSPARDARRPQAPARAAAGDRGARCAHARGACCGRSPGPSSRTISTSWMPEMRTGTSDTARQTPRRIGPPAPRLGDNPATMTCLAACDAPVGPSRCSGMSCRDRDPESDPRLEARGEWLKLYTGARHDWRSAARNWAQFAYGIARRLELIPHGPRFLHDRQLCSSRIKGTLPRCPGRSAVQRPNDFPRAVPARGSLALDLRSDVQAAVIEPLPLFRACREA